MIASRIGPASAGPFFHAKGAFVVFAGLLGLALGIFLACWAPRVKRFELIYATTICVVFAAALALLVAG